AVWPLRAGEPSDLSSQLPSPGSVGALFTSPANATGTPETTPPVPVPPASTLPPSPTAQPSNTEPGASNTANPPTPFEAPIWAGLKSGERERRKHKATQETDWGLVK